MDGLRGEFEGVQWKEEIRALNHDLLSLLGMGTESEKMPQQVVCCRAVGDTGGLDLQEWRVRICS